MKTLITTAIFLFLVSMNLYADERLASSAQLLQEGYFPVSYVENLENNNLFPTFDVSADLPQKHSLAWPIKFQDEAHSMANTLIQFQPFNNAPYFHGGCDLRVKVGAEVLSPVTGKLEAGHYSYSSRPDGSTQKFWKPWPEMGFDRYFEIAITTSSGIRHEFHHVNRNTLPQPIVDLLNRGGGQVEKGTRLGFAFPWGFLDYDHIHYNILLPTGTQLNPEYYSEMIPDHLAPEIQEAFAIKTDGKVIPFSQEKLDFRPTEFILSVKDKKDQNVYEHPPTWVRLHFESGEESLWDFRSALIGPDGKFPTLWSFFAQSIITPDGQELRTEGGYGVGRSLVRIKVPSQAHGNFTLEVGDIAGNRSRLNGTIQMPIAMPE
jgi:hypothetical protein